MSSIKTGMIFLLALLGFGATGLAQTSTTNGGGSGGSGPPDLPVNITGAPNGKANGEKANGDRQFLKVPN